jgi:hypothetical protein
MKKIGLLLLAAATALTLAIGSGSAAAANPEQDCVAAGGVWTKDPPNNHCEFPGTPPGKNKGGVTKDQETVSGPGKSEPNKETEECKVVNNGGSHGCTTT